MLSGFLNNSHFLQAIGWGILNSLWQTCLLWILHKVITAGNAKASATFKYNLSLCCLACSLLWFILTSINQYLSFENGTDLQSVLNQQFLPVINQQILTFLSFTYLLLIGFYIIQFGRQYISLYAFRNSQFTKAPVEIRLFTQQAAFRLGIKKDVGLWLSQKTDAPFVTGFFKPVILLPFSLLNHLTTAQAEAVILHELAHVKRNDYLVNIFQLIAEKLLFFSPFARLLSDAARAERENCCDDWVLNFRFNQHEYAHALLQVEQLRSQQLVLAMNATSGKKKLLKRIKRIFAAEPVTGITGLQRLKLIAATLGMLTALLLLMPVSQSKMKQTLLPVPGVVNQAVATAFQLAEQQPVLPEHQVAIKANTKLKPAPPSLIKAEVVPQEDNTDETNTDEPVSAIMLNEDLVKPTAGELFSAIQANDAGTVTSSVLVRVEEEVGGSKEKKIYYVQLNNTNGQTDIKPLAILNQPVADTLRSLIDTAKKARAISKVVSFKKPGQI